MKVNVKKEDKNSIAVVIFVIGILLSFSIGIFIAFFKSEKTSLVDVLNLFQTLLLFAICFFCISMSIFCYLFKSPRAYRAKLVSKKTEIYDGKQITYMEFYVERDKNLKLDIMPYTYKCYTTFENNLIVGNDYVLKIKEFNYEPKMVEEFNSSYENSKSKVIDKISNTTRKSVIFYLLCFLFGCEVCCDIVGIIYYFESLEICMSFGIRLVLVLIFAFKLSDFINAYYATYQSNEYSNLNSQKIKPINKDFNLEVKLEPKKEPEIEKELDIEKELEKIKPTNTNTKDEVVGNMLIKQLFVCLLVIPAIWFLIILKMDIPRESIMNTFLMISFVELPIIIMILYTIGYDDRLVKKYKVNILENINIDNVKKFNIFKSTKIALFSQYFIVDQNRNLILKIKRSSLIGNNFVICDSHNIKVGEMKYYGITGEFFIDMVNEESFTVRRDFEKRLNYQVVGRNYYVKSDTNLIRSIICDDKENEIAYITATSKDDVTWHDLDNAEVNLNKNENNNIDIMLISLCITMRKFRK